jgi:hypothetical protein
VKLREWPLFDLVWIVCWGATCVAVLLFFLYRRPTTAIPPPAPSCTAPQPVECRCRCVIEGPDPAPPSRPPEGVEDL